MTLLVVLGVLPLPRKVPPLVVATNHRQVGSKVLQVMNTLPWRQV